MYTQDDIGGVTSDAVTPRRCTRRLRISGAGLCEFVGTISRHVPRSSRPSVAFIWPAANVSSKNISSKNVQAPQRRSGGPPLKWPKFRS